MYVSNGRMEQSIHVNIWVVNAYFYIRLKFIMKFDKCNARNFLLILNHHRRHLHLVKLNVNLILIDDHQYRQQPNDRLNKSNHKSNENDDDLCYPLLHHRMSVRFRISHSFYFVFCVHTYSLLVFFCVILIRSYQMRLYVRT